MKLRHIKRIVIHTSAGWNTQTISSMRKYWKDTLKWKNDGYNVVVPIDGKPVMLSSFDKVTNGVAGYNSDSIHICWIGGLKEIKDGKHIYEDNRTPEQVNGIWVALLMVFDWMREQNKILLSQGKSEFYDLSDITILGHRDLSPDLNKDGKIEQREWIKVCPLFDAIEEYGLIMGRKAMDRISKGRPHY